MRFLYSLLRRMILDGLVLIIRLWQRILSPFMGNNCRFQPTCSAYAREALETHGIIRGAAYSVCRILRCNSLSRGGFEPVPPVSEHNESCSSEAQENVRVRR